MTPIRKDEKEHLLSVCNKKFNLREQSVQTEIQKDAQELSDKKRSSFLKLIKVDKNLKNIQFNILTIFFILV